MGAKTPILKEALILSTRNTCVNDLKTKKGEQTSYASIPRLHNPNVEKIVISFLELDSMWGPRKC